MNNVRTHTNQWLSETYPGNGKAAVALRYCFIIPVKTALDARFTPPPPIFLNIR